jgi:hypothetical protein
MLIATMTIFLLQLRPRTIILYLDGTKWQADTFQEKHVPENARNRKEE